MKLSEYGKEFNLRHDFFDYDLQILKSRWNKIDFKNIPVSWIILIDDFLDKANCFGWINSIKTIEQHYGQLIITSSEINIPSKLICMKSSLEESIAQIDADLRLDSVESGN